MAQDNNPAAPLTEPKTPTAESILEQLQDAGDETIKLDKEKSEEVEEEVEEKEAKEVVEEDEEDKEKDDEKELEVEEIEDEVDEEIKLELAPTRKEILAKYPKLFKEFPHLQTAMYRSREFSELFTTIEDAKEAVEKVGTLDKFEGYLLGGDTEQVLRAVKEQDGNAFNKIVNNYLPTLMKVDSGAYFHVIGNVLKQTIMTMANEGHQGKNEILSEAAATLNQFVFGRTDFTPPQPLEVKQKDDSVDKEREAFLTERFETSRDDLNTRVDNILKGTILENIDPKEEMTQYVKRTAIRESLESVHDVLKNDTIFKKTLDKLWLDAKNNNFNRESTDRIKRAYVNKARTVLPRIISKSRTEALKGLGKKTRDENVDRKGPIAIGKSSTSQNSGKSGKQSEFKPGMSTTDFLMSD